MVRYTNSQGQAVEIAAMAYPHLRSAYAKALRHENEEIALAEGQGFTYETSVERQSEIDAMAAEIAKRDEAYAISACQSNNRGAAIGMGV